MLMNVTAEAFVGGRWNSPRQCVLQYSGVSPDKVQLQLNGGQCTAGLRSVFGKVMSRKDFTVTFTPGTQAELSISF